jgi:hypothetical protein
MPRTKPAADLSVWSISVPASPHSRLGATVTMGTIESVFWWPAIDTFVTRYWRKLKVTNYARRSQRLPELDEVRLDSYFKNLKKIAREKKTRFSYFKNLNKFAWYVWASVRSSMYIVIIISCQTRQRNSRSEKCGFNWRSHSISICNAKRMVGGVWWCMNLYGMVISAGGGKLNQIESSTRIVKMRS